MTTDSSDDLYYRDAVADDAVELSSLAFRSKAHWGYSIEFMAACKSELTYTAGDINSAHYRFHLCCSGNDILGFYALELKERTYAELEALFVDPARIGTGIGRRLIEHCKHTAIYLGVDKILIHGDPNAEDFYIAAGAIRSGYRESASIPGRQLPLFTIELKQPGRD